MSFSPQEPENFGRENVSVMPKPYIYYRVGLAYVFCVHYRKVAGFSGPL